MGRNLASDVLGGGDQIAISILVLSSYGSTFRIVAFLGATDKPRVLRSSAENVSIRCAKSFAVRVWDLFSLRPFVLPRSNLLVAGANVKLVLVLSVSVVTAFFGLHHRPTKVLFTYDQRSMDQGMDGPTPLSSERAGRLGTKRFSLSTIINCLCLRTARYFLSFL